MVARGVYVAKEDGLQFKHDPSTAEDGGPCSPDEFLVRFQNNFEMNVLDQPDENTLVFEMLHCDTSFVNALRRILLAEVPTVALEHVYMWNNSSILHDEVLAHRLGLIPLQIDPRLLEDVERAGGDDAAAQADRDANDGGADEIITDRNTVVFKLSVTCPKKPPKDDRNNDNTGSGNVNNDDDEDEDDDVVQPNAELEASATAAAQTTHARKLKFPADRPYTMHVYSKDLVFCPQGDQEQELGDSSTVRPIHDDILIAKLRPGQAIELEAHGRRGIGKDHAKFSPVATASYRLMPQIELRRDVYDELAEELVHVYEPGVFELVPTDNDAIDPPGTTQKAKVCNPYACTMSRNYMRNPKLAAAIRMGRVSDHFIFSVESVGAYKPSVLVAEALRVLQQKCERVMDLIDESTMETESS